MAGGSNSPLRPRGRTVIRFFFLFSISPIIGAALLMEPKIRPNALRFMLQYRGIVPLKGPFESVANFVSPEKIQDRLPSLFQAVFDQGVGVHGLEVGFGNSGLEADVVEDFQDLILFRTGISMPG